MAIISLFGSGEFLPWASTVDRWCAERAEAPSERALVVPTASAPEGEDVFARWASMGLEHYRAIGLAPEVVPLRTREDASTAAVVDMVEGARLIFFSGGNPGYLAEAVRDTPFWDAVRAAVASGAALGGCSAGAVFLGAIAPFVSDEGGLERWVDGMRLLERAYVMPHFDMLDSYATGLQRLIISMRPKDCTGIGLDEETAMYGDGTHWQISGKGSVWVGEDGADLVGYNATDTLALPLGLRLD